MLNCREVSEILSRQQDGVKLSFRLRILLRIHLFMCASCSQLQKQFNFIRRAMQIERDHPLPKLDEEGRNRLRDAMQKKMNDSRTAIF